MSSWLSDIIFPVSRWLHVVCTTLFVGGTLFFELVLPIAIEDLKKEQQLYVFARARLVFRWVVWISVGGLLMTGGVSVFRMWDSYWRDEFLYISRWAMAHILLGMVAIVIGLLLTIGRRPPENPVRWMRLNLVILLVAIFLGSATRHFQLALRERARDEKVKNASQWELPPAATQPAAATTQPAAATPPPPTTTPTTTPGTVRPAETRPVDASPATGAVPAAMPETRAATLPAAPAAPAPAATAPSTLPVEP